MSSLTSQDAGDERRALAQHLISVGDGNRDALSEVYRRTSAKLFGVCLRILAERSEAEDVLQDIYVTVWQKAGVFDPARSSPMTWLITIARNKSIDRLRSGGGRRRQAPLEAAATISDPADSALERVEQADERRRLMGCLDELESQQRTAIRTAFLDGCTYEQLATAQGVPLGTMKSWVRRGLMKLRACLER